MSETIGFIGLGNLGLPMASNLLQTGYALRVYNRTASKAEPLLAQGAVLGDRPAAVATAGGIVASLVWDDAALESIVASEGFIEGLGQGGIHISMSTVLPATAKRMAAIHAHHGVAYIAAPVFGRPEAAVARQLWIPFAGPQSARERVEPLLKAMGAQGTFDFGEEVDAATMVKLVGNFLIISMSSSMTEAISMARASDVDPKPVIEMLTQTLFNAPIYRSYGQILTSNARAVVQSPIPLKDIGLFKTTAQQADISTPVADMLYTLLATAR